MSSYPRAIIAVNYAEAAREYLRSLPPEHFMEATDHSYQRKITLESFDLIHVHRPDIQLFNELLVQYPKVGQKKPGQVVPDNMVVICDKPIDADGSYDVPLQPVAPFCMLEYVSKNSRRKDYDDNFDKYEKELKVPYYLLFYPDTQDLTLYHLVGDRYVSQPPNEHGRYAIPELELEAELLDGWVRYWFRGELLPLPAELLREVETARRRVEQEKQRAEQEKQRAEQEKQRAEQEKQRAEQEKQRANSLLQALEQAQQERQTMERELEYLRAQLSQKRGGSS
jgi:Uma2 family endonuclease